MNYAVIDIGSNTLLLLIVKKIKSSYKILEDRALITRLSQGLKNNHFINKEAMNRSLKALKGFKALCDKHQVQEIYAIGTAALRNAVNSDVFLNLVEEKCGFPVHIISGQEEAELVFEASYSDFSKNKNRVIIFDIGGGSTEIVTGPSTSNQLMETSISLNRGTVNLTEDFIQNDPIEEEDIFRLKQGIQKTFDMDLKDFYPENFDSSSYQLIATSGTAITIAMLIKEMEDYDSKALHGLKLSKHEIQALLKTLFALTIKERQKLKGMEPLRADVIFAGVVLFLEIMNFFGQEEVIISNKGIRFGALSKKFI